MDERPALTLTHTFTFDGHRSTYTISFYACQLAITDTHTKRANPAVIRYSEIYKIRAGERKLTIRLRRGNKLVIPCTIAEIKQIKTLFKRASAFKPSNLCSLAFVEFGELSFFIKVRSNDYDVFRAVVIKRIAKFFYPAFDQEGIALDEFSNFVLKIRKGPCLVQIDCSEDLDAALIYFDYKIDVIIEYAKG